jgi:hypothetical protein
LVPPLSGGHSPENENTSGFALGYAVEDLRCVLILRTIGQVIDPDHHDEELFDEWDLTEEDFEPVAPPRWRRPLLIGVAAVTALALAILPLYNVVIGRPVADNGLEICGFDYCIVQDAMREAGVDHIMSRLANTYLDDETATELADQATDYLGVDPVGVQVVDALEGRLGGVYDPATRSMAIERPARAWTVLHEVAHTVETGHAEAYQEVLADLARWAAPGDQGG